MKYPRMLRDPSERNFKRQLTLEKRNFLLALRLYWHNRLMVLITSLVVAIALSFPSALLIIARNLEQLAGNWEVDLHVQLFLEKNLSSERHQKLVQNIETLDSVQSYRLVSAEEGLAEVMQENNLDEVLSILEENPLPEVLLVEPISQNEDLLQNLLITLAGLDGVQEAYFDQKWARTLVNFFGLLHFFTSFILQLLLIGLFVLIVGNVNALIARSHHEIRVIKLIGASDSLVSRPYIYFGGMIGLSGGICAFLLVIFVLANVSDAIINIARDYSIDFSLQRPSWYELLFLAIGPFLLGMFAAMLSCRSAITKAAFGFNRL